MEIIGLAFLAAVLIGVAIVPSRLDEGWRYVAGLVGLIIGFVLLLYLYALMLTIQAQHYQEIEAVKLAQMKVLQGMQEYHVNYLDTHDIRVEMRPTPHGFRPVWIGGNMEFEREDVVYWLKETLRNYPDLPTQHGLTGWAGDERDYRDELAAFTSLLCNAGLASWPSGNQGAHWLVKAREVPGFLGIGAKELHGNT